MKAGPGYIIYPTRLIDVVSQPQARELYGVINGATSRDGKCYSVDEYLAEAVSSESGDGSPKPEVSTRTIRNYIKILKDAGVLKVEYVAGKASIGKRRRVLIPCLAVPTEPEPVPEYMMSRTLKEDEIRDLLRKLSDEVQRWYDGQKFGKGTELKDWIDKFCLTMETKQEFSTGTNPYDVFVRWKGYMMSVKLNKKPDPSRPSRASGSGSGTGGKEGFDKSGLGEFI